MASDENEGGEVPHMPRDLVLAVAQALGMIWREMERANGGAENHRGEWHTARITFLPRVVEGGKLSIMTGGVDVDIIPQGAEHSSLLAHQKLVDGDNFEPPEEPPRVSLN